MAEAVSAEVKDDISDLPGPSIAENVCQEREPSKDCQASEIVQDPELDILEEETKEEMVKNHGEPENKIDIMSPAVHDDTSEETGVLIEANKSEDCELSEERQSFEDVQDLKLDNSTEGVEEEEKGGYCSEKANKTGTVKEEGENDLLEKPVALITETVSEECNPLEDLQFSENVQAPEIDILKEDNKQKIGERENEMEVEIAEVEDEMPDDSVSSTTAKTSEECAIMEEIESEVVLAPELDIEKEGNNEDEKQVTNGYQTENMTEAVSAEVKDDFSELPGPSIAENVSQEREPLEDCQPSEIVQNPELDILEDGIKEEMVKNPGEPENKIDIMSPAVHDDISEEAGVLIEANTSEEFELSEERQSFEDVQDLKLDNSTEGVEEEEKGGYCSEKANKTGTVKPEGENDLLEKPVALITETVSEECNPLEDLQLSENVQSPEIDILKEDKKQKIGERENEMDAEIAEVEDEMPDDSGSSTTAKTSEECAIMEETKSEVVLAPELNIAKERNNEDGKQVTNGYQTENMAEAVSAEVKDDFSELPGPSIAENVSQEREPSEDCQPSEIIQDPELDILEEVIKEEMVKNHGEPENKMDIMSRAVHDDVSEEPGVLIEANTSEECELSEERQSFEDVQGLKLDNSTEGVEEEEKGGYCSEKANKTETVNPKLKDDLFEEPSTLITGKASKECEPSEAIQSYRSVLIPDFDETAKETEAVTTEKEDVSQQSGASIAATASEEYATREPSQLSADDEVPELDIPKEGIEKEEKQAVDCVETANKAENEIGHDLSAEPGAPIVAETLKEQVSSDETLASKFYIAEAQKENKDEDCNETAIETVTATLKVKDDEGPKSAEENAPLEQSQSSGEDLASGLDNPKEGIEEEKQGPNKIENENFEAKDDLSEDLGALVALKTLVSTKDIELADVSKEFPPMVEKHENLKAEVVEKKCFPDIEHQSANVASAVNNANESMEEMQSDGCQEAHVIETDAFEGTQVLQEQLWLPAPDQLEHKHASASTNEELGDVTRIIQAQEDKPDCVCSENIRQETHLTEEKQRELDVSSSDFEPSMNLQSKQEPKNAWTADESLTSERGDKSSVFQGANACSGTETNREPESYSDNDYQRLSGLDVINAQETEEVKHHKVENSELAVDENKNENFEAYETTVCDTTTEEKSMDINNHHEAHSSIYSTDLGNTETLMDGKAPEQYGSNQMIGIDTVKDEEVVNQRSTENSSNSNPDVCVGIEASSTDKDAQSPSQEDKQLEVSKVEMQVVEGNQTKVRGEQLDNAENQSTSNMSDKISVEKTLVTAALEKHEDSSELLISGEEGVELGTDNAENAETSADSHSTRSAETLIRDDYKDRKRLNIKGNEIISDECSLVKAEDPDQAAKGLKVSDDSESIYEEPTKEDFQQARTRERTNYEVLSDHAMDQANSNDAKRYAPEPPGQSNASKSDKLQVQKDEKAHEVTGLNDIDGSDSEKGKVANQGSNVGNTFSIANSIHQMNRGVDASGLPRDAEKNIQNQDELTEIHRDGIQGVIFDEMETTETKHHLISIEEEKCMEKPDSKKKIDKTNVEVRDSLQEEQNGSNVTKSEDLAQIKQSDEPKGMAQEFDVAVGTTKKEDQQEVACHDNMLNVKDMTSLTSLQESHPNRTTEKAFNTSAIGEDAHTNDVRLSPEIIEELEDLAAKQATEITLCPQLDHDCENVASEEIDDEKPTETLVDGTDKGVQVSNAKPPMINQGVKELTAADIIASQISLAIEREEQLQQLSSQQLEDKKEATVTTDSNTLDNQVLENNANDRKACTSEAEKRELEVSNSKFESTNAWQANQELEEKVRSFDASSMTEPEEHSSQFQGANPPSDNDTKRKPETWSSDHPQPQDILNAVGSDKPGVTSKISLHMDSKFHSIPQENLGASCKLSTKTEGHEQMLEIHGEGLTKSEEIDLGKIEGHEQMLEVDGEGLTKSEEIDLGKTEGHEQMLELHGKGVTKPEAIDLEEHHKKISSGLMDEQDSALQVEAHEATICNVAREEVEVPKDFQGISRESVGNKTKAQDSTSPGEDEKQAKMSTENANTNEKGHYHNPEMVKKSLHAAESPDKTEKDATMNEQEISAKSIVALVAGQTDEQATSRGSNIVVEIPQTNASTSVFKTPEATAQSKDSLTVGSDNPIKPKNTEQASNAKDGFPLLGYSQDTNGKQFKLDVENRQQSQQGPSEAKGVRTKDDQDKDSLETQQVEDVRKLGNTNVQNTLIEKEDKEQILHNEKTAEAEDITAGELKTDEEKDWEGNDASQADSDLKAPFLLEASRDLDLKATYKRPHKILSGVGSKVKHSISKVKKVIACTSSQFSEDAIIKLNKNKKI